jgi:hypothetical protein
MKKKLCVYHRCRAWWLMSYLPYVHCLLRRQPGRSMPKANWHQAIEIFLPGFDACVTRVRHYHRTARLGRRWSPGSDTRATHGAALWGRTTDDGRAGRPATVVRRWRHVLCGGEPRCAARRRRRRVRDWRESFWEPLASQRGVCVFQGRDGAISPAAAAVLPGSGWLELGLGWAPPARISLSSGPRRTWRFVLCGERDRFYGGDCEVCREDKLGKDSTCPDLLFSLLYMCI